jgi:hypothetical protein
MYDALALVALMKISLRGGQDGRQGNEVFYLCIALVLEMFA